MNRTLSMLALAAIVGSGACSKSAGTPADTTLNSDLSLAAQNRTKLSLDSAERAGELNATRERHRATSSGEVARAPGAASHSTSGGTIEKHTQRDAAIGAAAGAILGATTSRNKVKGGVIGAVAGGILGGVIGNNVDKTKKKP